MEGTREESDAFMPAIIAWSDLSTLRMERRVVTPRGIRLLRQLRLARETLTRGRSLPGEDRDDTFLRLLHEHNEATVARLTASERTEP